MKCDRCDNEATVHELLVKSGKRQERHLCESCAKGEGLPAPAAAPITQLLTQYITSQVQTSVPGAGPAKVPPNAANNACPECGITFNQFRQTGLLGCPECYAAFEGQLSPLLARAHDRGTHHKGKLPRRLRVQETKAASRSTVSAVAAVAPRMAAAEVAAKVKDLRERLTQAVSAEQYELAARLRDELLHIEQVAAATPAVAQKASRKAVAPKAPRAARPPQPPCKPEEEQP